ncbi:DNA-binding response regulator [Pandoraea cepalis]|uniref:DNA-binding response regulator n=2 Tax=Pandoraea cepalis TaxID=2508294 RepID=A0A5E4RME3_9BURK|nr:DNA-binding response regulator [Pandoraea sp. NE5]VVD64467.1 DNA-binding response regulator [Pandoraea cepalis]
MPTQFLRGLFNSSMKLLLVEDNLEFALWLSKALQAERFTVECVHDGSTAIHHIEQSQYDLLLLDLRLPGMDGRSVLRNIRRRRNDMPVLVVTANASVDAKVDCLDHGADDYVDKPFELRELVARIKALIRRRGRSSQSIVQCADLQFDLDTHEFRAAGLPLELTLREHDVLETLMLRQGKTVTKAQLMVKVFDLGSEASENAIETYVHRLRRKLAGSQARILTLRGLGYLLRDAGATT